MEKGPEVLLALSVIVLTGCLSFAVILALYRLCCPAKRLERQTTGSRDSADRKLLGSSVTRSPRTDVKRLRRSAVRAEARRPGLYAGIKSLRYRAASWSSTNQTQRLSLSLSLSLFLYISLYLSHQW